MDIGTMYQADDEFRALARRHQAEYRSSVLGALWDTYGNRLTEEDGRALLNYYDKLGVREAKIARFPQYKAERDADMLRSEHIPFNMFGPLRARPETAVQVLGKLTGQRFARLLMLEFEWAPEPKSSYLDDRTAFDVYACCRDDRGRRIGVGVEVKYTERGYAIGDTESKRVSDPESIYWRVTRASGAFLSGDERALGSDNLRQIWRNHLLGLAMCLRNDVDDFVSVTLYPSGNVHFTHALVAYRENLVDAARDSVLACTYENYIASLTGGVDIEEWRQYLQRRYVV